MNRRTFLRGVAPGGALGTLSTSVTVHGGSPTANQSRQPRPTETIMTGTPQETGVYVSEGSAGPTALVVGGIHGDERPGYLAAERVARDTPTVGTVVTVPRANRIAIERDTRAGARGDLNRQFPSGERPTTPLARDLWNLLTRYDPDVVVDLHRSVGLYAYHEDAVGHAIFPTDGGTAIDVADATAATLTEGVVPWYLPLHAFRRGNVLTGSRPLLVHKVAGDLDRPGYIVETTRFLVDTETQTNWSIRATIHLLTAHGIEYENETKNETPTGLQGAGT